MGPGRYEEGLDRLRDRDRGRFEDRIDRLEEDRERQRGYGEWVEDRLDRLEERLARLEERAQRLLEDRGQP